MSKLKDLGDPALLLDGRKKRNVREHIDGMEKAMCNQYYAQLAKILNDEKERKAHETCSFLPN